MGYGWKVDVAAASAIIGGAADAGATMQDAAVAVDTALREVVGSLAGSDVVDAAKAFADARRGDATAAVRVVGRGIAAATDAMQAFAVADDAMAEQTAARRDDVTGHHR